VLALGEPSLGSIDGVADDALIDVDDDLASFKVFDVLGCGILSL
jgi:hypothetical protein